MSRPRTLLALVLMVTVLAHKQAGAGCGDCPDSGERPGWTVELDRALAEFPVALPTPPAVVEPAETLPGRPRQDSFAAGLDRLMGGRGPAPREAQTAAR